MDDPGHLWVELNTGKLELGMREFPATAIIAQKGSLPAAHRLNPFKPS